MAEPLTPEKRRHILSAISSAVRASFRYPVPPTLPLYPSAVPDLDRHIDALVAIVRQTETDHCAAQIIKQACAACPHQFPSRYCPLRPRGGCVLHRCAEPIAQAIATVLLS